MNLYIGNLSTAVQHTDLMNMFAGVGQVLYAKLADGADEPAGKGYAFVYVPNEERGRTAVESLNGTILKGEKLTVSPMSERPGVVGASSSK